VEPRPPSATAGQPATARTRKSPPAEQFKPARQTGERSRLPCQSVAPALQRQYYRAPYLWSCPAGPPAEPSRFPCIYPAYPGRPRANVGPALGPALGPFEPWSEQMGGPSPPGGGDLSGPSAHRAVPAHSVTDCVTMCALRNTNAGRGWLRLRCDNPACCFFCAVWVPWHGGGVAVAMVRGDQLTDVRAARFNTRICR
jgi:hypothetical protein